VAVRPLERLRQEVENRSADDLSPVSGSEVPAEVQPLVSAVNRHMARYEAQAALQSQFLDDASHQLRTPLSVLRTQVVYAMREKDPEEARQALVAMQDGLDRAVRTTNQLLALARARDASIGSVLETTGEKLDICELCDGVVRSMLPVARIKAIDLGLDRPEEPVSIRGVEWLLREALVNLVDNAIRYSPRKGAVTVHIACTLHHITVTVDDDGAGMSESDIARAGARFRRGTAGKNTTGAGLGLAIVRTIADAHGAALTFAARTPQGLSVSLVFSLAPPRRAAPRNENMVI
jgi:two-component system sensor histidine kinase TctE